MSIEELLDKFEMLIMKYDRSSNQTERSAYYLQMKNNRKQTIDVTT
ncbi:hypothetical protein OOJ74_09620 [Venenivibrio stagnispumantis]|nr:hypothetical protein [Venenivibrio stagnispumantis]